MARIPEQPPLSAPPLQVRTTTGTAVLGLFAVLLNAERLTLIDRRVHNLTKTKLKILKMLKC
jgi:hypothetical protein